MKSLGKKGDVGAEETWRQTACGWGSGRAVGDLDLVQLEGTSLRRHIKKCTKYIKLGFESEYSFRVQKETQISYKL